MSWCHTTIAPRRTYSLMLALALLVGVVAGTATPAAADAPAPDKATAEFEGEYLRDTIDHHAEGVLIAVICLGKARHEELRELCTDVVIAQSAEIQQLQAWLQDWYDISYQPKISSEGVQMAVDLAKLDGAEFEITFMEMLIHHHKQAIREAETCLDQAYHEELLMLCEHIIAAQKAEIEQLQTWLCEWYGRCKEEHA
jgi:uncharacterized protein (DUF305 family)